MKKTWPRKQSIIALYFEFGTALKFYNLEARKSCLVPVVTFLEAPSLIGVSMAVEILHDFCAVLIFHFFLYLRIDLGSDNIIFCNHTTIRPYNKNRNNPWINAKILSCLSLLDNKTLFIVCKKIFDMKNLKVSIENMKPKVFVLSQASLANI